MSEYPQQLYQHERLPSLNSIRVVELLPGQGNTPISCQFHVIDFSESFEYEAISYAWGDPSVKMPVACHGKRLEVTQNLRGGFAHFRLEEQSRYLWADALW